MELDPEIRKEFCQESYGLISDLSTVLEELEEDLDNRKLLEEFGQKIDRMMGAAKSLELEEMGVICELGKVIGYKSCQIEGDVDLISVVVAILFDTLDILTEMVKDLEKEVKKEAGTLHLEKFVSRLRWLAEKFKHVTKASCDVEEVSTEELGEIDKDLEDLIDELG